MPQDWEIVAVDESNVDELGFFCFKSKRKARGYALKREWLRLKLVRDKGRAVGFVETIPGARAWRAVNAAGYWVVHCLWVVGRAKNKGYGGTLLRAALDDARAAGAAGLAVVTSHRPWLADSALFLKEGLDLVDEAPPTFKLLVQRFGDAPNPTFPDDWDARAARYGPGLTVIRTDQCPYIEDGVRTVQETGAELGLETRVVTLTDCQQVQRASPTAFGVFAILYDGQLVSYYYLPPKQLIKRLKPLMGSPRG